MAHDGGIGCPKKAGTAMTETSNTRSLITVSGEDRVEFLQGLVTNDVTALGAGLIYAAMLTPQGKFLVDMFLFEEGEAIVLDINPACLEALMARMKLYTLRSRVTLDVCEREVARGLGTGPDGSCVDPRHPVLGWRSYTGAGNPDPAPDWTAIRVRHCIPETLIELIPERTFVLEAGFERLHGVNFHKGCYVGQEVTARMKHKTSLRKGLAVVGIDHPVAVGTPITIDARSVGVVYSQAEDRAIAQLRFDRLGDGQLAAGAARVTPPEQLLG